MGETNNGDGHLVRLLNSSVATSNRVDVLLVCSPEGGPVKVDDVLAGTLLEDELLQRRDGHTAPANTADGGHTWVVPAPDNATVDELGQLTLGKKRPDEVHAGKVPVVDVAQLESLDHPLVLSIAVLVLGSTESVSDALESIHDGAAEVVCGVDLPGSTGAVVLLRAAAIDNGVTHGLIGVIDRNLCADTPASALLGALLHFLEARQVVLDGAVPPLARQTVHALLAHLLLLSVIGVCISVLDHLHAVVVQFLEVVGGVGGLVGLDAHQSEVLDDGVLELLLLLDRIGVVETQDKSALVLLVGEVVVQQRSLCVADVQVSTGSCMLADVLAEACGEHTRAQAGTW